MAGIAWLRCAVVSALLMLGVLPLRANAQLVPVSFAAEALMTTSTGVVRFCGMRLFAVEPGSGRRHVTDGSVNIGAQGHGLVKAGLLRIVASEDPQRLVDAKPSAFELAWMKTADGLLLAPGEAGEKMKADFEGFHMFLAPLEKAVDFIERATAGVPVYVGFVERNGLERILNGRVTWDDGAREQFEGCLVQLMKGIDARLRQGRPATR